MMLRSKRTATEECVPAFLQDCCASVLVERAFSVGLRSDERCVVGSHRAETQKPKLFQQNVTPKLRNKEGSESNHFDVHLSPISQSILPPKKNFLLKSYLLFNDVE